jgi:hypothetical protein
LGAVLAIAVPAIAWLKLTNLLLQMEFSDLRKRY